MCSFQKREKQQSINGENKEGMKQNWNPKLRAVLDIGDIPSLKARSRDGVKICSASLVTHQGQ